MIPTTVITHCPNCGQQDATLLGESPDFEYGTTGDMAFQFVQCPHCTMIWLKNRPGISALDVIYPPDYIPGRFNEYLGGFIARLRDRVQLKKVSAISRYAPPGATIVDMGCGGGALLRLLRDYGDPTWRLVGVDWSTQVVEHMARLGLEGVSTRFEDLAWEGEGPQVVIMNQVIEHLEDPETCTRKVFELLRPGGIFFVETPSFDGWDAHWFRKRYWGGWHTPRHWVIYNESTLGQTLIRNGFEVIEKTYLLSPNFWLQSLHHLIFERTGNTRLAGFFDVSRLPALVLASLMDVLQLAVRGKTSNFRMVGRKPQSPARG